MKAGLNGFCSSQQQFYNAFSGNIGEPRASLPVFDCKLQATVMMCIVVQLKYYNVIFWKGSMLSDSHASFDGHPESWCETQRGEILGIQQSMQILLEGVQSFCKQQQHSTRVSEVHQKLIVSRCWSR